MSMPQILLPSSSSSSVFSKTCFYGFSKTTRHTGSLQLHILQPAWTLHSSGGARCKYFPLLRCYRKAPSDRQLPPRTIPTLLPFFFFKPYYSPDIFSQSGSRRSPGLPTSAPTEEASILLSLLPPQDHQTANQSPAQSLYLVGVARDGRCSTACLNLSNDTQPSFHPDLQ